MSSGRTAASSRVRRVGVTLTKMVCAGLATLLLVELGLRVVGFRPVAPASATAPQAADELHSDPEIAAAQRRGWLPRPSEVRTVTPLPDGASGVFVVRRNRLSLREDTETQLERPEAVIRVLCLGDSHTDGVCDNNDSYPHRLQRAWNAAPSPAPATKAEVLNAGWATSSPYQQLWAFERVYRRLRPDVVCIGFYAGNDLVDLMRSADVVHLERQGDQWRHVEPNLISDSTQATRTRWETIKTPFRRYSATYSALTQIRWLRGQVLEAVGDDYRNRLEQAHAAHAGAVWQDLNQAYYFRHHPDHWQLALRQQRHILARFVELSREERFALFLVVIPAMRQIHPETDEQAFAESTTTLGLDAADVATDERACDALVGLAQELKIAYLDLREPLRQAWRTQPKTPLYYRVDQHLNVAGNQVVAEALRESLTSIIARSMTEPSGNQQ